MSNKKEIKSKSFRAVVNPETKILKVLNEFRFREIFIWSDIGNPEIGLYILNYISWIYFIFS